MFHGLRLLKKRGYEPTTILDIGAHHGDWTTSMMAIYPKSQYYLFEAINYSELDKFRFYKNVKVFKDVILNETAVEVDWYEERNMGDSIYKEKTPFFAKTAPLKRQSTDLDTFIHKENICELMADGGGDILIKIDCQGAEIPILKGAKTLLAKTSFILLEMPLFGQYNEGVPTFQDHIAFMNDIGFIPYDILEKHYFNDFNMQTDVLFINKKHSFNTLVQHILAINGAKK